MFPLLMPMLIGAGLGAITNKKDPLKGAVIGAGLGAAGGTLAPGLLAGGGAAGTAGTGAAGGLTASAGAGTTLAAPASGSMGGGLGLKGLLEAAPAAESGLLGGGLSAPSTGYFSANAASAASPSLMEQFKTLSANMKPFGEAAGSAMAVKGLLAEPETPAHPPMPIQSQPLDLSGVLTTNQQEMARTFEEDMKRRQSMGEYARYAMGAR